jgi:hypothetical protein
MKLWAITIGLVAKVGALAENKRLSDADADIFAKTYVKYTMK